MSNEQIIHFHEEGYLIIPGAIPQAMIDEALRLINHSLGEEGMGKETLPTLRAQAYCPECREHAAIMDLANRSQLPALIETLIGEIGLSHDGVRSYIDARPSDAFVLATIADAPIQVARTVLDEFSDNAADFEELIAEIRSLETD